MSIMFSILCYRSEELPAPTECTDTNPPYEDTEPHTTQRPAANGSFGTQLISVIVPSRFKISLLYALVDISDYQ